MQKTRDQDKTKEQLAQEIADLRRHNAELQKVDSEYKRILEELRQIHGELAIRVKVRTAEVSKANEDLQKEIGERKRAQEELQHRLAFEKLISEISSNFINILPAEVDNAIKDALKSVGEFIGADRGYVFLFSEDLKTANSTHEWCAEGIQPGIQNLKGLNTEIFPWWMSRLSRFEVFNISHLDNLSPEAGSAKGILQPLGAKSLIAVPMAYAGRLLGVIVFISVRSEMVWPEEYTSLLKIIAEILANALQGKKSEEAVRNKEHFLRSIFDSIQDGLCVLNNELIIIRVNPAVEKWYSYAMPLVGKKCYQAYHGRNKPCEICPSIRTIENREVSREVLPKIGADGEINGWLELYCFPLFDAVTGQMDGVIEYSRDITETRRAEEALRRSEEKYRNLYESSKDGIVFSNLEGDLIDANQAYLDMLGIAKEELEQLTYQQLTPEKWHKMEEKIVKNQIMARGYSDEYEKEYIRKDNVTVPISIRVWLIRDTQGNPKGMWAIVRDITEAKRAEEELRKHQQHLEMLVHERTNQLSISNEQLQQEIAVHRRIEEALRESEEKYRLAIDTVPVGIGVADFEGKVYAANKNMLEMMGISQEELKTINIGDTYVDKAERREILDILEKTGKVKDWPVQLRRKDGAVYFAQLNIAQIEVNGKKMLFTAQRDITKQKQLEKELMEYHTNLETLIQERTAQLEILNKQLQRDIEERNRTEERITKINACFLGFGEKALENINHLTSLCGELLGADCVLYNRLEKGVLYSLGKWNAPEGLKLADKADGHICNDVIKNGSDKVVVLRNLPDSDYAKSDSSINAYNLQTYIGRAVRLDHSYVGSLCAVYIKDVVPSEEDKRFFEIIATAIGIEERRRRTQEALRRSEQEKAIILDSARDIIIYHDTDMKILWANKAAGDSINLDPKLLIGRYCWEIWHKQKGPISDCPVLKTLNTDKPNEAEITIPEGKTWLIRGYPVHDEQGNIAGVVELCLDVSERKEAAEKLEMLNKELLKSNKKLKQLALRDPHTGLFNHRYLEEVIEAEFYRARRYAHSLSLIMLDIDYFKSINDVYGYPFGDLVLKQLTQQLKQMVRRYDIIIRFSGEEFIILSPGTEKSQAVILAQRLLDALSLYNFGNKEHKVKLKLSIAVSSYPDDKIIKGSNLVELAEQMIAGIKEDGGNRVYSLEDLNKKQRSRFENHESGAEVDLLKNKIDKLNKQANQNLVEAIFAFAKTIEVKDHYTGEHVENTVHYATEIAKALNLPKDELERVKQASMLHDLGKIGISGKILLKNTKLSRKEFEIIKKHPQIGVDIIRPIKFLHAIISMIFYHHERWDGKGYPSGLRGEDIPIGARIIAVADVYQALISDRPYRKAFSNTEAVKIIKKGAGTQFDPHIVAVFLKILKKEK